MYGAFLGIILLVALVRYLPNSSPVICAAIFSFVKSFYRTIFSISSENFSVPMLVMSAIIVFAASYIYFKLIDSFGDEPGGCVIAPAGAVILLLVV